MGSNEERWNVKKLNEIKGTPWKPNPEVEDSRIFCNVKVPSDTGPVTPVVTGRGQELKMRRMRINPEDVKKMGLMFNCPGCRAIRDGKSSENHSEECRMTVERMLEEKQDSTVILHSSE
jgi:hypothetical protein